MTSEIQSAESLRAAWEEHRRENPKMRIRDAARALGCSEAELLATGVGNNVTRLEGDWGAMLSALPNLGHIMALTRNEYAVHERKGYYRNVSVNGMVGLVLDEEIDLRVFLSHWRFGFAVQDETRDGLRRSLQFFDRDGTAVHKVYLQADGNVEGYDNIVKEFAAPEQTPGLTVEEPWPAEELTPDGDIDFEGLYQSWRDLKDTHDFFGMLKSFKVDRLRALERAPDDLAVQVDTSSLRTVLESASASTTPIMIFVGSPGVIQIHGGPVERIVMFDDWVNVMDPRFNLHLRESAIASAWIVRKPTVDGVVTSLEVFDKEGEVIAMLFGKRKPGVPELESWRQVIEAIPVGA